MDYCKITTAGQAYMMPNPYKLTVANPTEEQKAVIAEFDNWLEMVYTPEPEYDPETQYTTYHFEEQDGKAVQVWEIHDKPIPPEPLEDRVENLESTTDYNLMMDNLADPEVEAN